MNFRVVPILFFLTLCVFNVMAQTVRAGFSADYYAACAPATIRFSNSSINANNYHWSFGNGSTSILMDPSIVYSQPGTYQVRLAVSDLSGNTDEITQTIVIYANPRVDFTVSNTVFCANTEVNFTSNVTSSSGIRTYTWDFGDGTLGYQPNPRKRYSDAGLFDVSLLVIDSNGCRSDTTKVRYIQSNRVPVAQFGMDEIKSCRNNVSISPNNFSNRFLNNTFFWDFGDGNTSTEYSPSHNYTQFGMYSVSLKVGNEFNCFDSVKINDIVEMAPLTAFIDTPAALCHDVPDTFSGRITPALSGPVSYRWEFPNNIIRNGRTQIYNLPEGNHTIRLSVTAQGCNASTTKDIQVYALPVRNIVFSADTSCDRDNVFFNFDFQTGDRAIWTLPDGQTRNASNGIFEFDTVGERVFNLMVTDIKGCKASFQKTVINSKAAFQLFENYGDCIPYDWTPDYFYRAFIMGQGVYPLKSITWSVPHMGIFDQEGSPPMVSVTDTGFFVIIAKSVDEVGCEREELTYIGGGYRPIADFEIDKTEICYREPFELSNLYVSGIKPNGFSWAFDGGFSELTPEKNYIPKNFIQPGIYPLEHIASHYGCNDTVANGDTLIVNGPMIDRFNVIRNDCSAGNITVESFVMDYEDVWFSINNGNRIFYENSKTFNLQPGDTLKLIASNNSAGCMDSSEYRVPVGTEPSLSWDITTDGCIPKFYEVIHEWTNMDSVRWSIDGIDILKGASNLTFGQDTFFHETSHTGTFRLTLRGFGRDCILTLDTIFTLDGPIVAPYISRSFGCFPMDFILFDPHWNSPNQNRRWVVDQDTIAVNGYETRYSLLGVKNPNNKTIVVKLLASEDDCETFFQFNYIHPGVRFTASFEEEPITCSKTKLKVFFDLNKDDESKVYGFRIRLSDTTVFSNDPKFEFPLRADGKRDTMYFQALALDGCVTVQTLYFDRPKPALFANFSVSDSLINCPPAQVQFRDLSYSHFGNITSYEWFLNGDFFSSQSNPSRIFTMPDTHHVSLVVKDDYGCTDTIEKNKVITILGPEVKLDFGTTMVCYGNTVNFSATGADALNIQWDMGDGNLLVGRNISHTYVNQGFYQVQVLVSDTGSCRYVIPSDDSIVVVAPPNPEAFIDGQCKNSDMLLRPYPHIIPLISHLWKIEPSGIQRTDEEVIVQTGDEDIINIFHKVIDSIGCTDSIDYAIKLYEIQAKFETDKPFYCEGEEIQIRDNSTSDTSISNVEFTFQGTKSVENPFIISSLNEGVYALKLKSTNDAGCSDSIILSDAIKIAGSNTKTQSRLKYVSVIDEAHNVQVAFQKEPTAYFKTYEIYVNAENLIWSSTDINDTNAIVSNLNPHLASTCLKGGSHHGCAEMKMENLDEHCTILAEGTSLPMARRINWSPYVGWGFVREYVIERKNANEVYEEIARVNGGTFEYTDYEHPNCMEAQWYRIKAVYNHESLSNTETIIPIWNYPYPSAILQNVSVLNNEAIQIEFETRDNDFFETEKVIVNKTWNNASQSETFEVDATGFFVDTKVDVNETVYHYQLTQLDQCQAESAVSNLGNSILLNLEMSQNLDRFVLNWSLPSTWNNNISTYYIQRKTDNTGFQTIAQVNNFNENTFSESFDNIACAEELCYRVVGVSPDNQFESISNEVCNIFSSALYVPNAATPNEDGLNDVFQPLGRFIKDYKMEIFDRWGKRVFQSSYCMQPWDCQIENSPAPIGIYICRIYAFGLDGKRYVHNGTITLLR